MAKSLNFTLTKISTYMVFSVWFVLLELFISIEIDRPEFLQKFIAYEQTIDGGFFLFLLSVPGF